MIKLLIRLFTIFTVLISLVSCSSNVGGGTGTGAETTNGIVLSSTGKPVVDAKVLVIDRGEWHENYKNKKDFVYKIGVTDSNGAFIIDSLPDHYNLQIDYGDEGIIIEDTMLVEGIELSLKKHGSFIGSVNDSFLNTHALLLAGTSYRTTIKSNGHFEFNSIPEGKFPVFAEEPDSLLMVRVLKLSTDSIVRHENIPVLTHSLLVEDFQTGEFEFTVLGRSTGSEWYVFNDQDTSSKFPYFNSVQSANVKYLNDGEFALHYYCELRGDYSQANDDEHPYSGIGFTLGESWVDKDTSFELKEMDSLTFKAKGNGIIRIKIGDLITDSVFGGEWNDFGYYLELESADEWKSYSITPDMLTLAHIDSTKEGHDLTWDSVANHIYRIEFEFNGFHNSINDDLNLWLDDIVIHGINLEQLIKYRKRRW